MYNIVCDKKYPKELDVKSLSLRINDLFDSNRKKVVYIKNEFDVTTFRYRAYNVIQSLENSNKYLATCFLVEELKIIFKFIDKIDLIVLQRCKWSFELESFINYAKYHGKKIIYDMDDLIYDSKYVPDYLLNIGDYTDLSVASLMGMSTSYKMAMQFCDAFIVSTPNLKLRIEKDFNKKTYVYHNFLNLEQENVSKKILKTKNEMNSDHKFLIGYFSGSATHTRDLDIALDDILKIMDKYDDVYFEIVGLMAIHSKFKKYVDNKRLIIRPFVNYQELQYLIGSVDLNIVPLQNNEFNNCKSELKYFEAGIVDVLTLASDNDVYGSVIDDGHDGFLTDEFNWYEKIEYIYKNRNKLDKVKNNAREKIINEYGCYNQTKKLEDMFGKIIREEI